jgi:hypothetical protein
MKLSPHYLYLWGRIKINAVSGYQPVNGIESVKTEFVLNLIPDFALTGSGSVFELE